MQICLLLCVLPDLLMRKCGLGRLRRSCGVTEIDSNTGLHTDGACMTAGARCCNCSNRPDRSDWSQ